MLAYIEYFFLNLNRGIQQQSMKELSGIGNGVNGKKRIKVSREHWILIKVLFLGFLRINQQENKEIIESGWVARFYFILIM